MKSRRWPPFTHAQVPFEVGDCVVVRRARIQNPKGPQEFEGVVAFKGSCGTWASVVHESFSAPGVDHIIVGAAMVREPDAAAGPRTEGRPGHVPVQLGQRTGGR